MPRSPAGALLRIGSTSIRIEVGDEPAFVEVSPNEQFGELVGTSFEMRPPLRDARAHRHVRHHGPRAGETGTGRGRGSRGRSTRRRSAVRTAFVPLDCGAVPEALFESELFGHVRGAFSGAVADRKGVIEEADGGTLFLDEIGELPLGMQAKLLRAIETRSVRRVGSNVAKPVDVRIVAATNRPLGRAVNEGTFREDLFYRLAVVEVALPPLPRTPRGHPHARLALLPHAGRAGRSPAGLPRDGLAAQLPGQRARAPQLRGARPCCSARSRADLEAPHLAAAAEGARRARAPASPAQEARQAWTESFELVYVRGVLERANGNVTHAAELAGVSRRFLQRLAARLGIRATDVGADPADLEPND